MRILLDQTEIQEALETYVKNMGLAGATGVELSLIGDEIQAEIIMDGPRPKASSLAQASTETTDQPPSKRRGRIPGSKNKPKGNPDVAADSEAGNDLDSSGDTDAGEEEDLDQTDSSEDESEVTGVDIFGTSLGDGDEETDGPQPAESTAGSKSRGNLFGDSDTESSEDTSPEAEGSDQPEEKPVIVGRKRPSIFDAD